MRKETINSKIFIKKKEINAITNTRTLTIVFIPVLAFKWYICGFSDGHKRHIYTNERCTLIPVSDVTVNDRDQCYR